MGVTYRISIILVSIILLCGCDKNTSSSSFNNMKSSNKEECMEPNNPYNEDGGHDAGFKWAIEHGGDCNGNSDSFNEGCEEYYRQLNQYNECIARNRK